MKNIIFYLMETHLKILETIGGVWVAQLVKCPTLEFSSGHDLRVMRSSPASSSMLGVEPA